MPPRTSKPAAIPVFDAGLRLLTRRAHSRVELRRKLERRGYGEAEIQGALARLAELGYADDASFASGHVRRRSKTLGPMALSAELAARGVDRRLSAAALEGFGREEQLVAATRLAERLCGRARPASYAELLNSVGTKLLRRGFPQAIAREACRAVWARTIGTPDP